MCEKSWLSSQMINLMATFMAQFVQMISYCAQVCICEWQTMLPKEVFFFFGRKNHFPFFECPKGGFFVKDSQIIVAKFDQIIFIKYQAIFNAQLTKWLSVKSFDPPLVKKTNLCRFSQKRVKFELQLPHSLLFIFSKNHLQVHKYLFNQRNTKKIPRFNHQPGTIIPAVLITF